MMVLGGFGCWRVRAVTLLILVGVLVAVFNIKSKPGGIEDAQLSKSECITKTESDSIGEAQVIRSKSLFGTQQVNNNDNHTTVGTVGSCSWSPTKVDPYNIEGSAYDDDNCSKVLSDRILASAADPTQAPSRLLLIGDSTMGKLYSISDLKAKLSRAMEIQKYCPFLFMCYTKLHGRCQLNEAFLYPPVNPDVWVSPNFSMGEGPTAYGLDNCNCQDCGGCDSHYSVCLRRQYALSNNNNNNDDECVLPWQRNFITKFGNNTNASSSSNSNHNLPADMYGGYFSIEYVRDVEIQTPFYPTTQENVAAFLHTNYVQDSWLLGSFGGSPICLASNGFHDMTVPNITIQQFVSNVEWFLSLLLLPPSVGLEESDVNCSAIAASAPCSHVIWLEMTSPKCPNNSDPVDCPYAQTVERTRIWNTAIRQMLLSRTNTTSSSSSSSSLFPKEKVTILEVFDASLLYGHIDNVHMQGEWYKALGAFLLHVMRVVTANNH